MQEHEGVGISVKELLTLALIWHKFYDDIKGDGW